MTDEEYMQIAVELAKNAEGWTNPNPMVGAILVKDGIIIGQGFHAKWGQPHAERNAITACSENPEGATLYVTLEPCCHYGKTPPCTDAILENRIARVVVGVQDPNPLISGMGIDLLRKAGVQVTVGILEKECRELNAVFFHYIKEKKPYVAMKYAMTMDGKIAAYTGNSMWITGEIAREHVHRLRHKYMGIMVGAGTVLKDDPRLDCRLPETKNPIRIICDTNLRIPIDSQIVTTAKEIQTYIATASADREAIERLREKGCMIVKVPKLGRHIDLNGLMELLGQRGIDSILLEGGGTLNWAALEQGIVEHVYAYIAPKIFGGRNAVTAVEGRGIERPEEAFLLKERKVTQLGEDLLVEYNVVKNPSLKKPNP
ncbi:bifunctional diaminohydroxyphosphoribosylaminopyrimidine deaminase/5-amino-6-(5-phosphoribosylamino)uracil reductase RibD [Aminipila luticellarii]|uniref:Riboflavin biosynthesis protein RibD n=1 Tax=Aminipila luticellarii TaxID=2507160 RepID=A0A410PW46_9FIRM|nr:bifunctional diaminohydroxyphosphoribosylaminopyrimidine deaminase/5-amino-6-(5-phosphoribosylamino)uracil reductase RibD [Aminipila luticellarii]QAT43106.1 bifunctional diaminohydroxyphosphoribosylaminopyrimidine deaminase/5-amino-6-(5-phosphoribosylamino)uracil reductase RibD [Aminipila luticellarii]